MTGIRPTTWWCSRVLPSVVAVCLFAQHPSLQQFTKWNLLLTVLATPLNIPPHALLLNSAATWIAFHLGATNDTKYRLLRKNRVSVAGFLLADAAAHTAPLVWWLHQASQTSRLVAWQHVAQQTTWVLAYYALVARGFDCQKQYVEYPVFRQAFHALTMPWAVLLATNAWWRGRRLPAAVLAAYVWVARDAYDLFDATRRYADPSIRFTKWRPSQAHQLDDGVVSLNTVHAITDHG